MIRLTPMCVTRSTPAAHPDSAVPVAKKKPSQYGVRLLWWVARAKISGISATATMNLNATCRLELGRSSRCGAGFPLPVKTTRWSR
jgi:hypothetical protein